MNPWTFWEIRQPAAGAPADLRSTCHELLTPASLAEVAAVWTAVPRLSSIFCDGDAAHRKGVVHAARPATTLQDSEAKLSGPGEAAVVVDGYAVFRRGILPLWEDPLNCRGGEWSCRKGMR